MVKNWTTKQKTAKNRELVSQKNILLLKYFIWRKKRGIHRNARLPCIWLTGQWACEYAKVKVSTIASFFFPFSRQLDKTDFFLIFFFLNRSWFYEVFFNIDTLILKKKFFVNDIQLNEVPHTLLPIKLKNNNKKTDFGETFCYYDMRKRKNWRNWSF